MTALGQPVDATRTGSETARIDAVTICRTCETVLSSLGVPSARERALLARLLRGHAGLLVAEVEGQVSRMRGEHRRTAEHVIARTRTALRAGVAVSRQADRLQDLTTLTRALLTLHERPGPPSGR